MALFGSGNILNMVHMEGLPGYGPDVAIEMELDEENQCLKFRARVFKNLNDVKLPLSKVTHVGPVRTQEIEQQSKMGRAIIGGVLLGGAGAIVGAMTAREKVKTRYLHVINYESDGEKKAIILKDTGGNFNLVEVYEKIHKYVPLPQAINADLPKGEITL